MGQIAFKKAVKENAKLRLAVCGPAGCGKTFTLLRLATELAAGVGPIAYVDTEHGSASKYAHTAACAPDCSDPSHFTFDVIEPPRFDPRELIETIQAAVEQGYAVVCCDSLSHYWMGPDGELEMVDNAARQSRSGNSFAAWKTITPIHNKLVDTMLSAPIHILVSMRTKTEWVIEKDKDGKSVPRKIGLTPVMRDGIEFEFDVCGDIDQDNTLTITKTRCSAITGKSINRPGRELATTLMTWLGSETTGAQAAPRAPVTAPEGAPAPAPEDTATPAELRAIFDNIGKPGYVRQGFDLLKRALTEAMPVYGETEYRRIVEKHGGLKAGTPYETIKAAMLDMWNVAQFARANSKEAVHA